MSEEIYYIYRWNGTGSYHFSVMGVDGQEQQKVADYVAQQAARKQIPQGAIQITAALEGRLSRARPGAPGDAPGREAERPSQGHPRGRGDSVSAAVPCDCAAATAARGQVEQLFRGDYPAKISVILPAANESVLLKRTVEQFAATLPDNSEVIVVDNGSTDGSADFLMDGGYENVHLISSTEALGVSGARNRGLAQAKGEIVVFADAHLDLPERWWQPIVCTLQRPEVGVVGPGIGIMGMPHSARRLRPTDRRVQVAGAVVALAGR